MRRVTGAMVETRHLTTRGGRIPVAVLAALAWAAGCGDGATEPPTQPPPDPPRPTIVRVSPATSELTALGATVQLTASVLDQNGQALAAATVTWGSSDAAVATVDGSGLVTAASNGTATITARVGGVSGTAVVTVMQAADSVVVEPAEATLTAVGDTVRLAARSFDANGREVADARFEWESSDAAVATVDSTGLVTAAGNGTATITARAGGASGTAVVTVMQAADSVVVEPAEATLTAVGDTVRLAARSFDANGREVADARFSWESNDAAVATVDSAGLVTATGNGTATITARAGGASATAVVMVRQAADSVVVEPAEATLTAVGDTVRLAARSFDANGREVADARFSWESSDAAVTTVDSTGLVTATGNGTATITARAGGATGTAAVTVMQAADSVVVEPAEATLTVLGDTVRLVARAFDANGREVADAQFSWESSDAAVATVDGSGLVTAAGNGTATITASAGSASGTAEIAVAAAADSPDRRTLETLYETTLGADWTNATNWLTSAPVGEWQGVEVDAAGNVIGLALSGNNLAGWIPPEIGDLDRLRYLHIDRNELAGPIPPELAGAAALTSLRIGDNVLSGPLPRSLLDLSLNEFQYADTGLCVPPYETFRDWIGAIRSHAGTGVECAPLTDREILVRLYEATDGPNWENNTNWLTEAPLHQWHGVTTDAGGRVSRLDLAVNRLSGVVPPEIGGLSSLRVLDLAASGQRALGGLIPPELGQLRQLRRLALSHNGFVGPIPPEIGNASSLLVLNLANNELIGTIPQELRQLAQLEALNLGLNNLTGELPSALGDLPSLEYLELNRNLLFGPIPASLLRLDLRRFRFEENPGLCAPGTPRFVSWLGDIDETRGGYCNAGDAAELARLHESAGGARWTRFDGWLAGQPLSDWYGVVTDSLGYVRELDLSRNGLVGTLPSTLGNLSGLTTLRIGENALSGPLPLSLTQLAVRELRYANTSLCAPVDGGFPAWLNAISSHEGTGLECAARDDRAVLETLYRALDGPNWQRSTGWLTDAPLGDWHGVTVDDEGRVVALHLSGNDLSGHLPAEVGNLSRLQSLYLSGNSIVGPIPAAIGRLSRLEELNLAFNPLGGEIPPEIGNLANLTYIRLEDNALRGSIPAEIGGLDKLEELILSQNQLTGSIPPELSNLSSLRRLTLRNNPLTGAVPPSLGELSQLEYLFLSGNRHTGKIPPTLGNLRHLERLSLSFNELSGRIPRELGRLANLEQLGLSDNLLTGRIPRELGALSRVDYLTLGRNDLTGVIPADIGSLSRLGRLELGENRLTGSIPPEFGNLTALRHLDLTRNRDMQGVLPATLTALGQLEVLLLAGTKLCAPREPRFLDWLSGLEEQHVPKCGAVEGSVAYVTQAVQSVDFPVPLVAGNDGLLRVFVRADQNTSESLPDVRARFFLDGVETHVVDIPAQSATIPTELEEGELARSANAMIPGAVLQPGLEMVLEIDPDGTLDPALGVTERIPATGRAEVDVRAVPSFDLTVIPFLAASDPDSSVLEHTRDLDAQSDLFRDVRSLLPIRGFAVTVHEPVVTASVDPHSVLRETEAIRVMEGRGGYHLGLARKTVSVNGVADLGGYSSSSVPVPDVIAHELGHNLSLYHAPCGGAQGPDPSFPQRDGSIGAWGFDFRNDVLVPPSAPDLMTYCDPPWISGYNFTGMLNHRLKQARSAAASTGPRTRSLLLWGGVDGEGNVFLDPAIVVDAPVVLPSSGGAYRLAGLGADGRELFSFNFEMPTIADGDGQSSFAYTLPAQSEWSGALESITLSGPEGSTTLDRDHDRPVTILFDPVAERVRAILRHAEGVAVAGAATARSAWVAEGLEVFHSRGIPDAAAWRR